MSYPVRSCTGKLQLVPLAEEISSGVRMPRTPAAPRETAASTLNLEKAEKAGRCGSPGKIFVDSIPGAVP